MLPYLFHRRKAFATVGNPWTPSSSDMDLWLDATVGVTDVSGAVSAWADQSDSGFDFSQGTAANRPTTDSRTLNGLNVIDFDGANDRVTLSAGGSGTLQPASSDMMIFAVIVDDDPTVGNSAIFWQGGGVATYRHMLGTRSASSGMIYRIGATFDPAIETFSTGAHLVNGYRNGSDIAVGYDGVYDVNGTPYDLGATEINLSHVGGAENGSVSPMNGAIAEIIVIKDYVLADRQKFEGYLAHKWGLQGNLPGGHPYESQAPQAE